MNYEIKIMPFCVRFFRIQRKHNMPIASLSVMKDSGANSCEAVDKLVHNVLRSTTPWSLQANSS